MVQRYLTDAGARISKNITFYKQVDLILVSSDFKVIINSNILISLVFIYSSPLE